MLELSKQVMVVMCVEAGDYGRPVTRRDCSWVFH